MMNYVQILMFFILHNQGFCKDPLPIIMIPGYAGSQIEAKLTNKPEVPNLTCFRSTKDFYDLWASIKIMVPDAVDCWADNIRMEYDRATHSTHSPAGVETRVPRFGDTYPVENSNPQKMSGGKYFIDLIDALVAQKKYIKNTNLRGAGYDFRRAPNDNRQWFVDMKDLTEATYKANGNRRIILICHSMGALIALQFLREQSQKWKDKHIASLISLGGAYGGTIKAVKLYTVGDDLGHFLLIDAFKQRDVQMTWSSVAYLMPSPMVWKPDEPFVEAFNKNFTVANIPDFFKNLSCPDCFDMWNDTEPFKDRLTHPGVDVYCLYGSGYATVENMIQNEDQKPGPPLIVYGNGDGTVNLKSLQACLRWNNSKPQKFFYHEYPFTNHQDILFNKNVIQDVIAIIEKIEE